MLENPLLVDLKTQGVIPDVRIGLPMMMMPYPDGTFREGLNLEDIPVGVLRVLEENTYRDPFLLARGKAVPKMIRHICPDILEPENLTEVDVEAILLAARLARFGPTMRFKHTCQNPQPVGDKLCEQENELVINLQEFILRYAPFDRLPEFQVTLPRLNQSVQLKPIRYGSAVRIMLRTMEATRRADALGDKPLEGALQDEAFLADYVGMVERALLTDIESIRDSILYVSSRTGQKVHDPEFIERWLRAIPSDQIKMIRDKARELFKVLREIGQTRYACSACGHDNIVQVQLDPQRLFTPAEESDQPRTHSAASPSTGRKGKSHSRISRR